MQLLKGFLNFLHASAKEKEIQAKMIAQIKHEPTFHEWGPAKISGETGPMSMLTQMLLMKESTLCLTI